jgi:hypothetical protein
MRIVAGSLFIVAATVVLAPSSRDLHNRYGEPDLERFTPRLGINVTVKYGSDHLACSVLIEPSQPLVETEEQVPHMSSQAVTEILEEILPMQMRGKLAGISDTPFGFQMETIDYENVWIIRSAVRCCSSDANRQEGRATILFKRYVCASRFSPLNLTPSAESVPKSWDKSR